MIDEICALQSSCTWELDPLPNRKSIVECRWLNTLETRPDGNIDHYKSRLVVKRYTKFGQDNIDTFSLVAKMTSIRLPFSIAITLH